MTDRSFTVVIRVNQSINQSIICIYRIGAIGLAMSRIGGATVCRLRCVSMVKKQCFKIRSKSESKAVTGSIEQE